ncbi:MAG: carbonic anhydrase family protein, partial [Alphaproteobacteria bacterium]|nr:carbonic anhydrase family protein [Alphaproteobacteria bacterium]
MKILTLAMFLIIWGCKKEWSYNGKYNSQKWGDISQEFKFCKIGFNQSPIDIDKDLVGEFKQHELEFNYQDSVIEKINQKYHQKLVFYGNNFLLRGKKKYWLRYIEFHHPSEHQIESNPHSLEMQIYHKSDDEQWLVVSFFLELDLKNIDLENHNFENFIEFIKSKTQESKLSLTKLINKNSSSFFYEGSFTSPPCQEGVKWYIMKEPQYLGRDQLNH